MRPPLRDGHEHHRAAVGRVLDRVVDEVREHLAQLVGIGRDRRAGPPALRRRARGPPGLRACATSTTWLRASRRRSSRSRPAHLPRVEAARPEDVVHDAREPVGLARDHVEQPRRAAPARPRASRWRSVMRGAVDRGERRSQLVRDGRDEVASSAGRPRARRSRRGTRRPCRRGTARPRSTASVPRPSTSTGTVSGRAPRVRLRRDLDAGAKRRPVGEQLRDRPADRCPRRAAAG